MSSGRRLASHPATSPDSRSAAQAGSQGGARRDATTTPEETHAAWHRPPDRDASSASTSPRPSSTSPSATARSSPSANTPEGHAELAARLAPLRPRRVVLEATGGLEAAVAAALAAAGLPVLVVNPRQVRDFAKAMGHLAKTDAIDARVLAHFAAVTRAEPRPLPDEAARELDALLDRRRQLIGMRTMEQNRLATGRRAGPPRPGVAPALAREAHRARSTASWTSGSAPARRGARRTTCCGASRGSARCSAGRCWRACPSWGRCPTARRRRWWGWRRWPTTAAGGAARGASPGAARWSAACCTWRR